MSRSNVKYVVYVSATKKWRVKLDPYVIEKLPHLVKSYTLKHKVDAENWAKEIARQLASANAGDLTSINTAENTVMGLLGKYRETLQFQKIKAGSKRDYDLYFSIACSTPMSTTKTFGEMLINNVTADHVDRLQAYVKTNYSYNTSFTTVSRLRTAWYATERHGLWRVNPFIKMGLVRPTGRKIAWDTELTEKMIQICDDSGYQSIGTLMVLCLHFAQRVGDMRQLTWDHIDFDFICPKSKQNKIAFKFVQEKTGQPMMLYATSLIEERLKLHTRHNMDNFVFRNDGNAAKNGASYMKPYTSDLLRKRFLKLRRSHDIPENLWLADFRRTAATSLADCGATEAEIMSSTGHASEEVLRRVYLIKNATQAETGAKKRGIA